MTTMRPIQDVGVFTAVLLSVVVTVLSMSEDEVAPEERPSYCFEDPGNGCRATHFRYFYNHTLGECESFYYGGCGGGRNIFTKKSECETACKRDQKTMRAVENNMKCAFYINYEKECYGTNDGLDNFQMCGELPYNFFNHPKSCQDHGCCWHPFYDVCWQSREPVQPVTCKITYASKSVFYGKIVVSSHSRFEKPLDWVGILKLDTSVNGEFCIIKDEFSSEGQVSLKRVSEYTKRDRFFIEGPASPVYEGIGNSRAIHFVGRFRPSSNYDTKLLRNRCSDYSLP